MKPCACAPLSELSTVRIRVLAMSRCCALGTVLLCALACARQGSPPASNEGPPDTSPSGPSGSGPVQEPVDVNRTDAAVAPGAPPSDAGVSEAGARPSPDAASEATPDAVAPIIPDAEAPVVPDSASVMAPDLAATPVATDAGAAIISDDAHLDVLSISYDGADLRLSIDHGNHPALLSPAKAIIELRGSHRTILPETPELPFLGAPGESVWHLDGGWSVRDVEAGLFVDDEIEVHLEVVEAPGAFAVWRYGVLEPQIYFASVAALPQTLVVDHTAHAHRTWSLSEPGVYVIGFSASARRASDGVQLRTELQEYAFHVLE